MFSINFFHKIKTLGMYCFFIFFIFFMGVGVLGIESTNDNNEITRSQLENIPYSTNEIIVKFTHPVSEEDLTKFDIDYKFTAHKQLFPNKKDESEFGLSRIYIFTISRDQDIQQLARSISDIENIEYAHPNVIDQFTTAPPNDPLYSRQWHLPKVSTLEAWDASQGNPEVIIAIADTGIALNHPDLINNIWRNEGEIPNNNIDDDDNYFVDDYYGWDFVSGPFLNTGCWPGEDCYTEDNLPSDFYGHGTNMAGIAAGTTNNNEGVASMCPNCKIMAVRNGYASSLSFGGSCGTTFPCGVAVVADVAQSIIYAADNHADIISMSFSGANVPLKKDAIDYAYSKGAILVAAAGNQNAPYPSSAYPAAYPNVLAIAATDQEDKKASFSNYGSWVAFAAPGVDILSTALPGFNAGPTCGDQDQDGYEDCSGTSSSTPMVAGVIGLVLSAFPQVTQEEVAAIMHFAVDPINEDMEMGSGSINAAKAVEGKKAIGIITGDQGRLAAFTKKEPFDIIKETTTFGTAKIKDVEFNAREKTWIAVGNSGKASVSNNGYIWEKIQYKFGKKDLKAIATDNNSKWIIVGDGGDIFTSTNNGFTWSKKQVGAKIHRDIEYSDKGFQGTAPLWVVVSDSAKIRTSADGITWTKRTPSGQIASQNLFTVAHNGESNQESVWVVGGEKGRIGYSRDGIQFMFTDLQEDFSFKGVAYGNNLWVAVGSRGKIYSSSDGITWTQQNSGVSTSINAITYNDQQGSEGWIAVANQGKILTSSDGVSWTARQTTLNENLFTVKLE